MRLLGFLFAFALVSTGCDDGGSNGHDGDGGLDGGDAGDADGGGDMDAAVDGDVDETPVDVVAGILDGICDSVEHCDTGLITGYLSSFGTANCKMAFAYAITEIGGRNLGDLQRLVDDGVVTVEPEALAACFANHANECSFFYGFGVPCLDAFEGTVADGGDCMRDEVCAGDAYCHFGEACPGECAPQLDIGETCTRSQECEKGDHDVVACNGKCLGVTYETGLLQGQDCGEAPTDTETEITMRLCAPGYYCADGFCQMQPVAGGVCDDDNACPFGYQCANVDGTDRCTEVVWGDVGDTCGIDGDYECNRVGKRLICGEDGHCEETTDGLEGDACADTKLVPACAPGFFCHHEGDNDICRKVLALGEECTAHSDCQSAVCHPDTHECIAYCAGPN